MKTDLVMKNPVNSVKCHNNVIKLLIINYIRQMRVSIELTYHR